MTGLPTTREEAWARYAHDQAYVHLGNQLARQDFEAGFDAGLRRAAEVAAAQKPEMGTHINVSQYRSGKFDAATIIESRILAECSEGSE